MVGMKAKVRVIGMKHPGYRQKTAAGPGGDEVR